ncbi:SRPBCC domain-containing protein [Streptomyces sp. DT24]|uniref:SRPBCC domain-containing protein n=1 Tax=unclassified Streptomyces TaxID=2593676 RepID=UPI003CF075A7
MSDTTDAIERGTGETRDGTHVIRFTLRLPHSVPRVWAAVATPGGLRGWLAEADPFEPRLGGAVTLRGPGTDVDGRSTAATGTITAWDVERVAEYTLDDHPGVVRTDDPNRVRFHLEPPRGSHVLLRFSHEFPREPVGDDRLPADALAAWHHHFEHLVAALEGHPATAAWRWDPDRWRQLREGYR